MRYPPIVEIAKRLGVETAQVIFRFAMQAGMIPLTGTSDEQHMKEDLGVDRIALTDDEVNFIESVSG